MTMTCTGQRVYFSCQEMCGRATYLHGVNAGESPGGRVFDGGFGGSSRKAAHAQAGAEVAVLYLHRYADMQVQALGMNHALLGHHADCSRALSTRCQVCSASGSQTSGLDQANLALSSSHRGQGVQRMGHGIQMHNRKKGRLAPGCSAWAGCRRGAWLRLMWAVRPQHGWCWIATAPAPEGTCAENTALSGRTKSSAGQFQARSRAQISLPGK